MSKDHGFGKFLLGAAVGAGIALLFAPHDGKETRRLLKERLDNLANKIKDIEPDDVIAQATQLIDDIKTGLKDLDKEKVKEVVEEKSIMLLAKADELVNLAVEKGTPIFERAAYDIKSKTSIVLKDIAVRLDESNEKQDLKGKKKKTTVKKVSKK